MRTDVDDLDLASRLRQELGSVSVIAPTGLGSRAARRLRQRRLTRAVAAVLLVGVLGGGLAVWRLERERDESSRVATEPGDAQPAPVATTEPAPVPGLVGAVADHPVLDRVFPVVAWTGSELIVWGGEFPSETDWHADGAAYDPATNAWRDIAAAPIGARSEHVGVWTGRELVVCCGRKPEGVEPGGGAYDPASDTWRRIADSPVEDADFAGGVWTGAEVLVVGPDAAAAYDPIADAWRTLSPPPPGMWAPDVAWSGERLYAWSKQSGGGNFGAQYVLADDEWSVLPDPPDGGFPTYADIEMTRAGLAVWGIHHAHGRFPGPGPRGVGAIWDPSTARWAPMSMPLPAATGYEGNAGSQTLLGGGDQLFVATGSLATTLQPTGSMLLRYDVGSDTWHRLDVDIAGQYGVSLIAMGDGQIGVIDSGRLLVVDASTPSRAMPAEPPLDG